jgi:hypothetical protein
MAILNKADLWSATRSLALSTLSYLVVFETYVQVFVLKAFSLGSTLYIHADGSYREATPIEEVLHAVFAARFFFWRALAVAAAATSVGMTVVTLVRRRQSTSLACIMVTGSVVGAAASLASAFYFHAWDPEGLWGFVLPCVAAAMVAVGSLWRRPNSSLEGDACKATRASG